MEYFYDQFGKGKTTLEFFHYFGGSKESWKWVAEKLSDKYKVILVTLPGFGNTEPLDNISIEGFSEFIKTFLKTFKLDRYFLVGHSMSAKLILNVTVSMNSEMPKGLILVCPSPPTIEQMTEDEREKMMSPPDESAAKQSVDKATVRKLKSDKLQLANVTPLLVEEETWKWWVKTGMLNDISSNTKKIEVPVYVISAEEDPIIPIDDIYTEVLPNLKNPKLKIIQSSGHLLPLERPKILATEIDKFCTES